MNFIEVSHKCTKTEAWLKFNKLYKERLFIKPQEKYLEQAPLAAFLKGHMMSIRGLLRWGYIFLIIIPYIYALTLKIMDYGVALKYAEIDPN